MRATREREGEVVTRAHRVEARWTCGCPNLQAVRSVRCDNRGLDRRLDRGLDRGLDR